MIARTVTSGDIKVSPQTTELTVYSLCEMLTQSEWQVVAHLTEVRQGEPVIIAWSVGFLTLQQLDQLLEGGRP